MSEGFWLRRRVFVTGHTGFMGGWLCQRLAGLGAEVTGYALPAPTDPSFFEATRLWDRVPTVTADVRDADRLAALMAAVKPEIVFHLAAQPLVRRAHVEPVETFATNVMGTVNLLDAMRRTGCTGAAVIVTTDKVYENREWPWGYRETDTLGGREPYGVSKACAEMAVAAYAKSYFGDAKSGPGVATVRAGNIIGGGDWAEDRLVPDAVRAFTTERPLEVRHPDAVRPWQHVLEPVTAMIDLAERLAGQPARFSGAWNFGPEESDMRPVSDIADAFAEAWGDGASWSPTGEQGPYEAKLLTLASAKAKTELGWRCRWTTDEAVRHSAEWYRAFYEAADMAHLTDFQINCFLKGKTSAKKHQRPKAETVGRAVA